MPVTGDELRDAMRRFPAGVAVLTVASEGQRFGLTVGSLSSVSLEPPLVLFSLARKAYSFEAFCRSRHFAVNVLAAGQAELADSFAQALADKWAGVEFEVWDTDCPIIRGAHAQFECRTASTHDGGDHVIFLGSVERMAYDPKRWPLIYYRSRYRELSAVDDGPAAA